MHTNFIFQTPQQLEDVESVFRQAAANFGGCVHEPFNGGVSFGGTPEDVIPRNTGFYLSFLTEMVNRYINGKVEPELEISCDSQGAVTYCFLRSSQSG